MTSKEELIKQINKLMAGKIIEISIIIILAGLSIPAWESLALKFNDAEFIEVKDCNLDYKKSKENNIDYLTISNNYALNKRYKIYLKADKSIDLDTKIIINNGEYFLRNFYNEESNDYLEFTILDKTITASTDKFNIKIANAKNKNYDYIFEEIY